MIHTLYNYAPFIIDMLCLSILFNFTRLWRKNFHLVNNISLQFNIYMYVHCNWISMYIEYFSAINHSHIDLHHCVSISFLVIWNNGLHIIYIKKQSFALARERLWWGIFHYQRQTNLCCLCYVIGLNFVIGLHLMWLA